MSLPTFARRAGIIIKKRGTGRLESGQGPVVPWHGKIIVEGQRRKKNTDVKPTRTEGTRD